MRFGHGLLGANTLSASEASTYDVVPCPVISEIRPDHGPYSTPTEVKIIGKDFGGATEVRFGSTPVIVSSMANDTEILVVSPTGTVGTSVPVAVIEPGCTPPANPIEYTYDPVAPTVIGVDPDHGPPGGGSQVTILGSDFTGATAIKFGSNDAETFSVESGSEIKATSPAGIPGETVDVTVTNEAGSSKPEPADEFTYGLLLHTLTVNVAGTGSGEVLCEGGPAATPGPSACAPTYPDGTEVALTAIVDTGSAFVGWSGDSCSGTDNCVVALSADIAVTANFEAIGKPIGEEPKGEDGGGSTPPPAPCLSNPTLCAPGLLIAGGSAQVKSNRILLKVRCQGEPGARCEGVAKLFAKLPVGARSRAKSNSRRRQKARLVLIGRARYKIATAKSKTVKVKIANRRAMKMLKRRRVLRAQLRGMGIKFSVVRIMSRERVKGHSRHRRLPINGREAKQRSEAA